MKMGAMGRVRTSTTGCFYEYYSVPFRMAIEDGHANAMMTSYNSWNKVPMGANPILHKVVMKDWGFDGIICTDAGALGNMVRASHTYATNAEAAAAAIHAGINQFLENATKPVQDALAQNLITEADLDANLRGVFRVMIRLGMLEPAGERSRMRRSDGTRRRRAWTTRGGGRRTRRWRARSRMNR